ncbi:hypothetical protein EXIGLDRAFT_752912 [Exidia glandulosa HHB12029]|uniref:Uncharacterized protein n=1 Tax=Exidia glandulosa HHB12029 TaxID=1314781 RepID=A0A165E768_EXIGL|nr:hypothetical protein EXIGLDRAFT_752912 [Exidia glandulosa HHB12029]
MFLLKSVSVVLAAIAALVLGAPILEVDATQTAASPAQKSPVIRWIAVGIAAVLAILQGIISALTAQCSASRWWTVRFWILRNEHIYWSIVVLFLCTSIGLNVTFIIQSGSDESTSLLVTAATIGVVIYQYLITTWSQVRFRHAWWLAWTGRSRTRIQDELAIWVHVSEESARSQAARVTPGPIERGAVFLGTWKARHRQVRADPTDILRGFSKASPPAGTPDTPDTQPSKIPIPYASHTTFGQTFPNIASNDALQGLSLLWGGENSIFARRVSRAIESIDGDMWARIAAGDGSYIMRWAALSHGILGRNKGLEPDLLEAVGINSRKHLVIFEEYSSLGPRPAKTKRSFVKEHMTSIYGSFPEAYRILATELALLLEDAGPTRVEDWLKAECEHQDWNVACEEKDSPATGRVLYRLSYLVMVASLNFGRRDDHRDVPYLRPELMIASAFGHRVEEGWTPPDPNRWAPRIAREVEANPGCREWVDKVLLSFLPLSMLLPLEALAACCCAALLFVNSFTVNAGWWTLRFYVFRREHIYWSAIEVVLFVATLLSINNSPWHTALNVAAMALVAHMCLVPACTDALFRETFWRAWTGRSRTRIQTPLVPGLRASPQEIERAAAESELTQSERGLFFTERGTGVVADPTAILQVLRRRGVAASIDSDVPSGVETPLGFAYPSLTESGGFDLRGTSLLWGPPRFKGRVSRAVVALDGDMWASISSGGSASYLLAWASVGHGILGRNKGLNPSALAATGIDAEFEHASTLGPRPAKTKRSVVREHMRRMYGLLGDAYVLLATELALLLEDAGPVRVQRWLAAECEHQDPAVAMMIPESLPLRGVQYRLHYVVMLASLNFGDQPRYVRPELLVLKYLGPRLMLAYGSISEDSVSMSWMEKLGDRLEAERRANPGCEDWLRRVTVKI